MPIDDLSSLCGRPRTIRARGRAYRAWPLRLRDVADFQAWLYRQVRDPVELIRTGTLGMGRGAKQCAIRIATKDREDHLPVFGTPWADSLARSVDGLQELLRLSIRRSRPRFGPLSAERLYWAMGGEAAISYCQWALWGDGPKGGGASEDDEDNPRGHDSKIDWWGLFRSLCGTPPEGTMNSLAQWSPRQVAELTLPQLLMLNHEDPPGRFVDQDVIRAIAAAQDRRREEIQEWNLA